MPFCPKALDVLAHGTQLANPINLQTSNPKPYTLNPEPPCTLTLNPYTLSPKPPCLFQDLEKSAAYNILDELYRTRLPKPLEALRPKTLDKKCHNILNSLTSLKTPNTRNTLLLMKSWQ